MWTMLVAGLCAFVVEVNGPFVVIGTIDRANSMCNPRIFIGEDGMTPPLKLGDDVPAYHFGVEIGKQEAIVSVDGKNFTVPRGQTL